MAVNPAEEIVNVWLQDVKGYFTRQNINVKKFTREINGRKIGGGRGKEIDILAINNEGERIWVEVSVSPNPRREFSGKKHVEKMIQEYSNKFNEEKKKKVNELFRNKEYTKLFVYSPKLFTSKSNQEEEFCKGLKAEGISVLSFVKIFHEMIEKIDHYSVDPTRIYLYYSKFFPKKIEEHRKQ